MNDDDDALPMRLPLQQTILNVQWLLAHAEALQQCFPEHWTPLHELNAYSVGARLRQLGVDWHGDRELAGVLSTLQRVGVMRLAQGHAPFARGRTVQLVQRGPLVLRSDPPSPSPSPP